MLLVSETAQYLKNKVTHALRSKRGEIGLGTVLGIVLVFAIFAFIVLPQGRAFITILFDQLNTYWLSIRNTLFPPS